MEQIGLGQDSNKHHSLCLYVRCSRTTFNALLSHLTGLLSLSEFTFKRCIELLSPSVTLHSRGLIGNSASLKERSAQGGEHKTAHQNQLLYLKSAPSEELMNATKATVVGALTFLTLYVRGQNHQPTG